MRSGFTPEMADILARSSLSVGRRASEPFSPPCRQTVCLCHADQSLSGMRLNLRHMRAEIPNTQISRILCGPVAGNESHNRPGLAAVVEKVALRHRLGTASLPDKTRGRQMARARIRHVTQARELQHIVKFSIPIPAGLRTRGGVLHIPYKNPRDVKVLSALYHLGSRATLDRKIPWGRIILALLLSQTLLHVRHFPAWYGNGTEPLLCSGFTTRGTPTNAECSAIRGKDVDRVG